MNNSAQLWALAVPGILTHLNDHDHALLGGAVPSPEAAGNRTEVLRRDWNVNDRASLLEVLDWLAREGHRREFNDVCAIDLEVSAMLGPSGALEMAIDDADLLAKIHFSRRHRARIGARGLLAWDAVRLVTVAGWGYLTQLISAGEAWSYIFPAAQAAQRVYASWEELGKHHLLGREFWAGHWDTRYARCLLSMLDDPAGPWQTLPWRLDLNQRERMVPLQEIIVEPPPPPGPLAPMRNPFMRDTTSAKTASGEDPAIDRDDAAAPPGDPVLPAGDASRHIKIIVMVIAVMTVIVAAGIVIYIFAFNGSVVASPRSATSSVAAPSVISSPAAPPRPLPISPSAPARKPGSAPPAGKH